MPRIPTLTRLVNLVVLTFLHLAFWCVFPVGAQSQTDAIDIQVKNRLVNIRAENASFKDVLRKLQEATGVKIEIFDGVVDKEVSVNISLLPLFAIGSLLDAMRIENFAIIYNDNNDLQIYILPFGKHVAEVTKGGVVVRSGNFTGGNTTNRIKGSEIVSTAKGKNSIPLRYVKDEILLKFHRGVSDKEIKEVLARYNLVDATDEVLSKIGYRKVRISDRRDVVSLIRALAKERNVKSPEPNYIANIMAVSDPLYVDQWYIEDTGFDKAWESLKDKTPITVAVIDSGVYEGHPDLAGKLLPGYDFVNDNSGTSDDNGHGTFVAGIIAAANNAIGIRGLYDYAQIIPVKVIDKNGFGTYEDVAKGIIFAVDNRAKVLNLSLGGYGVSSTLQDAVDYALEKGCIIVAAGGNDGIAQEIYPAAYPNVIGVSALENNGNIWRDSNRGRHIDVSAPGVNILSTGLAGDYVYATGTSASAAMGSALAAMLISEKPNLSSSSIANLISQTAKDLGEKGYDKTYGSGEIDASSALDQQVRPFHDVAVQSVSIEPLIFEKRKPTSIVATIKNAGTYASETFDAVLYEIIGAERKEIDRKKDAVVFDQIKVIFDWQPKNIVKGNFNFEVWVFSKDDSTHGNNSRSTYKFSLSERNGFYVLYKTKPPVHQWIAFQAYNKLPDSPLKKELSQYLPTSSESGYYSDSFVAPAEWRDEINNIPDLSDGNSYPLIEGAWEEDEGDRLEPDVSDSKYCHHFWDPDGGWDAGYDVWDPVKCTDPYVASALEIVQRESFKEAMYYYDYNKGWGYYWLGRASHLLMDMSVPAHTLLDTHPGCLFEFLNPLCLVLEGYEAITGEKYKVITSQSLNTEIPNRDLLPAYPHYTPQWFIDDTLTRLFYSLAETSNDYDSDDNNGKSDARGNGKFRFARKEIEGGKLVSNVEYWKPCFTCEYVLDICIPVPDYCPIRNLVRYADYDIIQNDWEYRIYFYESFYHSINNTPNVVKVRYTDGTMQQIENLDENFFNDVWDEPLVGIYQPELQARAIGHVAALYQLFWDRTHGSISGTVVDGKTNRPISAATVNLFAQFSAVPAEQINTDSFGSFSFKDLTKGSYYVIISKEPFDTKRIDSVVVTRGDNNLGGIYLTPSTIDTDGDGLTDYEELYVYHTKPYTKYSDEDSLTDGQEIALGTNPNNRDTDGDLVDDDKDVFPLDPLRWTPDITSVLELLLLSPVADLTVIGTDKVSFETVKIYPTSSDKTGCSPQTAFVGKFSFDALLENMITSPPFSGLMVEVAELVNARNGKKENRLIMPNGGMGVEGDRFAVPQIDGYSDGILWPGEFLIIHFDICLASKDPFRFFVNLLGLVEAEVTTKGDERR